MSSALPNNSSSRRPILLGLGSILPAIISMPAVAMILEEDDEELVLKAKANRAARLAQGRTVTREFLETEGIKNKQLALEIAPLQTGVYKLAKSGAKLTEGDVKAVANSMAEPWVADFIKASKGVGGSDVVADKVQALKTTSNKGDLNATKAAYVALVAELKAWSAANGVAGSLVGL